MSRPALLDVNVLVAIADPDHIHHEAAHDWFAHEQAGGWATCPVTEAGFIRVLTSPAYRAAALRPAEVAERLKKFCSSRRHVFWPDAVSLRDARLFNLSVARGHRQITDIYLLGLARHMSGRLATFDGGIPLSAVAGATRQMLAVIASSG